jgi:flagellar hook-length control protein FliK
LKLTSANGVPKSGSANVEQETPTSPHKTAGVDHEVLKPASAFNQVTESRRQVQQRVVDSNIKGKSDSPGVNAAVKSGSKERQNATQAGRIDNGRAQIGTDDNQIGVKYSRSNDVNKTYQTNYAVRSDKPVSNKNYVSTGNRPIESAFLHTGKGIQETTAIPIDYPQDYEVPKLASAKIEHETSVSPQKTDGAEKGAPIKETILIQSDVNTSSSKGIQTENSNTEPGRWSVDESSPTNRIDDSKSGDNFNGRQKGDSRPEAGASHTLSELKTQTSSPSAPQMDLSPKLGNQTAQQLTDAVRQHTGSTTGRQPVDTMTLAQNIRFNLAGGRQELTLQLKPETLGRALIQLHREDDRLKVEFTVERPEARHAIEAQVTALRDNLVSLGFQNVSIEVRTGSDETLWNERAGSDRNSADSPQDQNRQSAEEHRNPPSSRARYFGYNTFDIAA